MSTGLILPEEKTLITTGGVEHICYSPPAIFGRKFNKSVQTIEAIEGQGLKYGDEYDRYTIGQGSFNVKTGVGTSQVSFMNLRSFENTQFSYVDSWRNVFTRGVKLLWLLPTSTKPGRRFRIGTAWFQADAYLVPCETPSARSGKPGFKQTFFDCSAILASVIKSGTFQVNDPLFHENRGY